MATRNKDLIRYKVGATLTMITPMILALTHITHATIWLFTGYTHGAISMISGSSIVVVLYLFCMSYVFRLCAHFRMALYYLLFVNLFYLFDTIFKYPLNDKQFILGIIFAFGISVIIFCYLIWKYNRENKRNLTNNIFNSRNIEKVSS